MSSPNPAMRMKPLVLVVDDEPRNLQLVGGLLKGQGYDLIMSASGPDAIDSAKENFPDLILMDVMMPGMDGYEVAAKLKKHPLIRRVPIIFLTAVADTEGVVKGFESGGVDYVTKPFRAAELLARIKTHIELYQLRGLLPICCVCRKMREPDDTWVRMESYLHKRTGAAFTHTYCPECAEAEMGKD